jgi:hypothetical protein
MKHRRSFDRSGQQRTAQHQHTVQVEQKAADAIELAAKIRVGCRVG